MPGTDVRCTTRACCAWYGVSGTDVPYCATRDGTSQRTRRRVLRRCASYPPTRLLCDARVYCCAMPNTAIACMPGTAAVARGMLSAYAPAMLIVPTSAHTL
eukprot:3818589-Rhodomonas_salina.2